jgi:aldose 1-epimerase
MTIAVKYFGTLHDGRTARLYCLTNCRGDEVCVTDYGATIVSLSIPDRYGDTGDIVLGYDGVENYEIDSAYLGATIGRYANRIANAHFILDDIDYYLSRNEGHSHLHGGFRGFNKRLWEAHSTVQCADRCSLTLRYLSQHLEEGYPGNVHTSVTFMLNDDRELHIDYEAYSDKDTIINLTNHSYFNLNGSGSIEDHFLALMASEFTPIGSGMVPTGELQLVAGTAFDFRENVQIGNNIDQTHPQLERAAGFDHNFVLDRNGEGYLVHAASLSAPASGRIVQVWTSEPAIQFYSGNRLEAPIVGKGGKVYGRRSGLCLETQHFPDSPNHQHFPSTVLKAQGLYKTLTIYKFSAF